METTRDFFGFITEDDKKVCSVYCVSRFCLRYRAPTSEIKLGATYVTTKGQVTDLVSKNPDGDNVTTVTILNCSAKNPNIVMSDEIMGTCTTTEE